MYRLPLEAESAALGGALQAAAVHRGQQVGAYVRDNQPPVAEKVSNMGGLLDGSIR